MAFWILARGIAADDSTLAGPQAAAKLCCVSSSCWLQDLDLSVDVTPTRGRAFTPSKVLLMNRERKMNMLSPDAGQKLWHTDIETGKVVSEWGFEKDGVEAPMKVSECLGFLEP